MKSPIRLAGALVAGLLLSCQAVVVAAEAAAPKKILLFSKSSGFEHDAIKTYGEPKFGYAFPVLKELGAKLNIEFTFSKDGSLFTPEYLAQFDAFFFYTTGDLTKVKSDPRGDSNPPMTPAGKAALLKAVADGKGFLGTHSATDSFHSFGRNAHVPERFLDDGDHADDYVKMLARRRVLQRLVAERSVGIDAWLSPTVPMVPTPTAGFRTVADVAAWNRRATRNTRPGNLFGQCGVSLPIQHLGADATLPVGLWWLDALADESACYATCDRLWRPMPECADMVARSSSPQSTATDVVPSPTSASCVLLMSMRILPASGFTSPITE